MDRRAALKRVLLTSMIVAGLATLTASTISNFNATIINSSNTFQSGTLVLKESQGATTCLSTGSGVVTDTNNATCTADNLGGATGQKPGGAPVSQTVTLKDDGTIDGASFMLWSAGCASSDAGSETYHGTGDLCTVTDLTIYDSTHSTCLYPQTSGACTLTVGKTLSDFATAHSGSGSAVVITPLTAGSTTTFVFTAQLEATAPNSVQGRVATIDFHWYLSA
jgi:hypothetical protein